MPYIKREKREEVFSQGPRNPGELNYLITEVIQHYIRNSGGFSYQVANDIIGALEGAKLEFYRRLVQQYEDRKIKENGDVYG